MAKKTKTQTPKEKPNSVDKRQVEQKSLMIETLEKVPVIQVACKRVGISRATYYRWKGEDKDFERSVGEAIHEGTISINDLAQSKIIELINKGHLSAVIFWLKTHDSNFIEKRKVDFKHETVFNNPVSDEKIAQIENAMKNWGEKFGGLGEGTKKEPDDEFDGEEDDG